MPRFVVAFPATHVDAIEGRSQRDAELAGGVDAPIRAFFDEVLDASDVVVDLGAGRGFVTLGAATAPARTVRAIAVVDQADDAAALAHGAVKSGVAGRVEIHHVARLDEVLVGELVDRTAAEGSRIFLRVAAVSAVCALLDRERALLASGGVAAVVLPPGPGREDALHVLSSLGYGHFALAADDSGVLLLPSDGSADDEPVFSLAPPLLARLSSPAAGESPTAWGSDAGRRSGTVSLIMPTYRRLHCLVETVEQLLFRQTVPPAELIIVNNDPTPASEDAIRRLLPADERIVLLTHADGKQGACRNAGLRVARGEYVAFVDDDDDYATNYVEVLAAALDGGARVARCKIQTCGQGSPDCTGKPTQDFHPLTPNAMVRRDHITTEWGDPPCEDRQFWSRHSVDCLVDECLVFTCHGPGRHSPRARSEGGSFRTHFRISVHVTDDVRFVEGCIASIAQQSYRNFTCLLNDDRSADGSTQVIQRLVAGDERFIWHRPTQRYTSARERLLGGGALGVQPDDVVISLKGCDCFSHTNVLNRLNHLYSENPELWLTFGNFVTDPFIPGWPTASFPPAVWQSGGFRAAGVPIGAAVPLTFRGFLLEQPAVARTPVLPPPDYESTANDAALLLPLLELSTAAHAYPLAEVLCVRSVAKQANADPERRRRDVQLQGALRAHPPARALPSAPRPENPGSHTEDIGSVAWIAPIYEATGYADEARNYVHGLQDLGVAVAARSINQPSERYRQQLADATRARLDGALASAVDPDFIAVVHFPAFAFQPIAGAAYTIGRTMYETDSLPAEWVQRCNQLDEIWVPTRFNLETFRRAGVTARLVRIPGGIDTAKFRPGHAPLPLPGTRGTVFLSVFKWEHRKGWDVLLRAWARAFAPGDDVTLVLRTYAPDAPQGADHQLLIERRITNFLASELGRTRAEVAPIVVLTDEIADEDLPRLYAAAHAYAAPSRGEGWGRPQMEAMACGLPVLATRWSGTTEFMTDENSLLIDVEALVEEQSDPALRGHRWAEPSAEHLASLMRRVCSELEATADLGRRAAKDMREHWGWDRAARAAVARLGEVRRELSARPAAAGASGAPGARGPRGGADSAGGGPSGATPVRWEGSQFVHHSLARVNRELCRELLAGGAVDLEVIPFEAHEFTPDAASPFHGVAERINRPLGRAAAVHVRHQWPPRFDAPPEGAWVMIQPWEFGGIPGSWVAPMRDAVDEIWVPSAWVRQCYVESGVPADKVVVVPNGVDTDLYRPEGPRYPLATAKRFKFLAVGGLIPRKGIDILIETYLTTFTAADDVCLVVKGLSSQFAYHGNPLQQRVAEIAAATRGHAQLPEIELVPDTLGDEEIAALYRSCDAFVSPFRGEGFGLPIAEAMAAALPVIVTGAGPVLEFCDAGTGYLIPSADVTVPDHNGLPASSVGYWWAEPDRKAFATLMRQVAAEPEAARRVGRRARARIVERFRWTHAAAAATARILTLAGRTPVRHAPTADFNPAVEPLRLDERRGFAFLHHPNWHDAAWKDVLASYVRAFDAGDDVTLVLCLDPRQGIAADTAATAILEVLAATRGSSETAPPDLLLVPDDLTLAGLGALYTAVDCVVCGGDPVQATRARHAGKPVLARLAPGAWRAAYAEGTSARRAQPLYSTP